MNRGRLHLDAGPLVALYRKGLSIRDITPLAGVSYSTVVRTLRKYVVMRGKSGNLNVPDLPDGRGSIHLPRWAELGTFDADAVELAASDEEW